MTNLQTFTDAYIECAERADGPEDGGYDWALETLERFEADAKAFYEENEADITDPILDGYDFWLTRNGHGTGFWDRNPQTDALRRLNAAARAFGNLELYIGDGGKVYVE